MSRFRGWLETLRAVFRRGAVERDMAEEFRYHLDREVEENIAAGMSPEAARAAAARTFGAMDLHAEATRDARGVRWVDDLRADVRLALRGMRRVPGTAAITILTLTLGIGASLAIFSIVNGVLLEPLPYPQSDRLVSVWGRFLPESGFDFEQFALSPPEYADYREQNTVFEDIAAYSGANATLVPEDGEAVRIEGTTATANLFGILGVQPALGRAFTDAEDDPGAPDVAILSHGLWQSAFGGDPAIIGRVIQLNGAAHEVVGVMPPEFSFPGETRQIYTPLRITYPGGRQSHFFTAVGRLRADATMERANIEMAGLMERWKADYPDIHTGHFLFLRPYVEDVVGSARQSLGLVAGAVGLVLLLVCLNVAHVLLARSVSRQRELAVCAALGASRTRLVRQTLTESALFAVIGTVLGLVLARVSIPFILGLAGSAVPRAGNVSLDMRVAFAAAAVVALVTMIAGMLPALRARLADPQGAIREGDRASTGGAAGTRMRGALVVAEVALAAVVVVAAALLVRSFDRLLDVDPGFVAEGAVAVDLTLPARQYDFAARAAFHQQFRDRLLALPGVTAVAGISAMPLGGFNNVVDFVIENEPPPAPGQPALNATIITATPGMPEALGVEVLEGRFFSESDVLTSTSVTVVSRALAERFFPDGALGRRLRVAGNDTLPWATVVGVVDDVLHEGLDVAARGAYYFPLSQMQTMLGVPTRIVQMVRAQGDPLALVPSVRSIVRELDPGLPVTRIDLLEQVVKESVASERFTLALFAAFAVLALILGGIGLYGVLSCAVAERTRELGIRMALGARRGAVARMVIGQGLLLTLTGLGIGLVLALVAGRVLASMLFQTSPTDLPTFAFVSATLFAVAFVACATPALRALRLDPNQILRH